MSAYILPQQKEKGTLKEIIPSPIISVLCSDTTLESYMNYTPSQVCSPYRFIPIYYPSKRKKENTLKRLAPWCNLTTHMLKQKTHKFERKRCSTTLEESRLAWQDSHNVQEGFLPCYSRKGYYSVLMEENSQKPWILFSTGS